MRVGKTDVFERKYMQKFRALAGCFGEFVVYERDRGARDIGLHLARPSTGGGERLSPVLCWFQLKGIMKDTLTREDFRGSRAISVPIKVAHLRFWYLQTTETYLVVYVEAVDTFYVLNIKDYIAEHYGKSILTLGQRTVTVEIPKQSVLDEQSFTLILRNTDMQVLKRLLRESEDHVCLLLRDWPIIWLMSRGEKEGKEYRLRIVDWQTKLRGEVYLEQRRPATSNRWEKVRGHWQLMLSIDRVEGEYPYLDLAPEQEAEENGDDWFDEDSNGPPMNLKSGRVVRGEYKAGELIEYKVSVRLNKLGQRMARQVETLGIAGIVEVPPEGIPFIDVAPWHGRSV